MSAAEKSGKRAPDSNTGLSRISNARHRSPGVGVVKGAPGSLDAFISECLQSGKYRVDANGEVWDLHYRRGHTRRLTQRNSNGYFRVHLRLPDGRHHRVMLHRLLVITFKGLPPEQRFHVDHINAVKTDNRLSNLEWVEPRENCIRATAIGLSRAPKEERHNQAKITQAIARSIHRMHRAGQSGQKIAREVSLSPSQVSTILLGRCWPRIAAAFHGAVPPSAKEYVRHDDERIRDIHRLRAAGKSQCWIANELGLSESFVSRALNGKKRINIYREFHP